jgi:hypothetical protein
VVSFVDVAIVSGSRIGNNSRRLIDAATGHFGGANSLSMTVKTIQQSQTPLSGSPTKRISEKKAVVSSLFAFICFRSSTCRRFPLQFDLIVINRGSDEIFQGTLINLIALE